MTRVFILDSYPQPTGTRLLLDRALNALPADEFECRSSIFPVRNWLDLQGWRTLDREIHEFKPDVIHVIGERALRYVTLYRPQKRGIRICYSDDLVLENRWINRSIFKSMTVVTFSQLIADRYKHAKVQYVPPGVEASMVGSAHPTQFPNDRLILAGGRYEFQSRMRHAAWSFDCLKYPIPDVRLICFGNGPDRAMVERHAYSLAYDNYRTHFIDTYAESSYWIDSATMAWATQKQGDTFWILQAMAAGKPVISYDTDEALDLIEDGKTGRLIADEDRIRFSAISRELLLDPASAESLGSAASASVLRRFPMSSMVEELGKLYHGRGM